MRHLLPTANIYIYIISTYHETAGNFVPYGLQDTSMTDPVWENSSQKLYVFIAQ